MNERVGTYRIRTWRGLRDLHFHIAQVFWVRGGRKWTPFHVQYRNPIARLIRRSRKRTLTVLLLPSSSPHLEASLRIVKSPNIKDGFLFALAIDRSKSYFLHFLMPVLKGFVSESHRLLNWRRLIQEIVKCIEELRNDCELAGIFCRWYSLRFDWCLQLAHKLHILLECFRHLEHVHVFKSPQFLSWSLEHMFGPLTSWLGCHNSDTFFLNDLDAEKI